MDEHKACEERRFCREVRESARKMEASRESRHVFWQQASWLGVAGWLFVLPVVGGAWLGHRLDRGLPGKVSWAVAGLVFGILVGAANLWVFSRRRSRR